MKHKFILSICISLFSLTAVAGNRLPAVGKTIPAHSSAITYTGRTEALADGSVRYDWVGTYLQTDFTGGAISVRISDSKKSYHNVFIDGKWMKKICVSTPKDTTIVLAGGLTKTAHRLMLQKCTEGEYGCTTVHAFLLAKNGTMKAVAHHPRMIEIYGDSYTCGYGSEAKKATDPFRLDTENCDKAYGCILARYFDADYVLIAHSGRGVVHNYGDSLQLSRNTMTTRMTHIYDDFDATKEYGFNAYKPDLVIINLGTNDFSAGKLPTFDQFLNGYVKIIGQIRAKYGKDIPIFCILAHSGGKIMDCLPQIKERLKEDKHLYVSNPMLNIVTEKYDMGASYHPNYTGHQKVAMTLIPAVSAIMGWAITEKPIR